jgi:hypothetical protein
LLILARVVQCLVATHAPDNEPNKETDMSSTSYKTRTLQVSYDGTNWNFTQDVEDEGSDPKVKFSKPTYLYFVAVGNSLTFNASNPVTWDKGSSPPGSSTTVVNDGCLLIIDPDTDATKTKYSVVLNMTYNGTAVTTNDPIIVNKPNT